jgi:hypothetical protein
MNNIKDCNNEVHRNAIILENMPPIKLKPLNICTIYSHYNGKYCEIENSLANKAAPRVRAAISLEDALMLLIASVYILTASVTARRKIEICKLRTNCVIGCDGQYEMEFELAKANVNDEKVIISRPIPNFLAKALKLVKRLTCEWSDIFGIEQSEYLFLIPSEFGCGKIISDNNVTVMLDRYCDYVEIPLDCNGRRWYIRTHESRRFFAMVFFWQFKYTSLTALQWMLGHVDPKHTYAYIKETLSGKELTKEEARFTVDAIKGCRNDSGINKLRQLVKKQFKTENAMLIGDDELELYLESLIEQGVYKIQPHSITTQDNICYEILFEVNYSEIDRKKMTQKHGKTTKRRYYDSKVNKQTKHNRYYQISDHIVIEL